MIVLCARVSMGASGLVSGSGALRAGPVAGGRGGWGGGGLLWAGPGREEAETGGRLWFGTACRQEGSEPSLPFTPSLEWP